MASPEYPAFEVIKFFVGTDGEEHLIGEIIVAVTPTQEQELTTYEKLGFVRFIGWSKPDREHEEA